MYQVFTQALSQVQQVCFNIVLLIIINHYLCLYDLVFTKMTNIIINLPIKIFSVAFVVLGEDSFPYAM